MSFNIKKCHNEQEWLDNRVIGGSTASAVIGKNPYMTNLEVWQILTKIKEREFKTNEFIEYGKKAEAPLRELFALRYKDIYEVVNPKTVEKDGYIELYSSVKYPFMTVTPDGFLIEKATGKKGIYEGKTTSVLSSMHKEQWGKNKMPDNYYIQLLHTFLVLGDEYEFAVINVEFLYEKDGEKWSAIRSMRIEREDVKDDLEYLLQNEVEFWTKYVETKKQPPLLLPEI